MTYFCTEITSNQMIANAFESFVDKNISNPSHRAKQIGLKSSFFLINAGVYITILFGLLCLLLIMLVISKIELGKISLKFADKVVEFKNHTFLRFWIQTYLSFGIFALIDIQTVRLIQEPKVKVDKRNELKIFSIAYFVSNI